MKAVYTDNLTLPSVTERAEALATQRLAGDLTTLASGPTDASRREAGARLDALAAQMERVSDPTMNTKLQQALDALEEEIRSAM